MKCGQIVAVLGETSVETVPQEDGDWGYESLLRPRSMYPAPPIIKSPEDTPKEIRIELALSFQMFWSDPGSCATKIRTSVERLMDHFGVTKMRIAKDAKNPSKPGKMKPLDLSARIDKFISTTGNAVHKDHLHALRRIGNLGTHMNTLSRGELLDTYEVYEHALEELIGKKSAKIARLAKRLAKKG